MPLWRYIRLKCDISMKTHIHPADLYAGRMLRLARIEAGVSQQDLGRALNVTFQQVQKYEKAYNRMSISVIADAARYLHKPVSYFFAAGEENEAARKDIRLKSKSTLELIRLLDTIKDSKSRVALLHLARIAANAETPVKSEAPVTSLK